MESQYNKLMVLPGALTASAPREPRPGGSGFGLPAGTQGQVACMSCLFSKFWACGVGRKVTQLR